MEAYKAKDYAKALSLFEKAVEQDECADAAYAQLQCGWMYYKGEGTAVDKVKAKLWFQKVAAQTRYEYASVQAKA